LKSFKLTKLRIFTSSFE